MKSFYISLIALFLVGTAAQAQEFSYGIMGGLNVSKVNNALGGEFADNKINYHVGLIAEFPQGDKWSFEAAAFYSGEGEQIERNGNVSTIYLRFINVPVHFKYYITKGLSVHAGPQVGFLLNAKQSFVEDGDREEIEGKVNSSYALTGGLGYDFDNGLFIKGTFDLGITDLFDNVDFKQDQRTRTGHLSIGYKF
ncbi:porin family protein [Nonlabens sp.]|uniref:porin family protein n=1 Tax=Nonlabens sp. TaxID=1888209 RepID=UPI003F698324